MIIKAKLLDTDIECPVTTIPMNYGNKIEEFLKKEGFTEVMPERFWVAQFTFDGKVLYKEIYNLSTKDVKGSAKVMELYHKKILKLAEAIQDFSFMVESQKS